MFEKQPSDRRGEHRALVVPSRRLATWLGLIVLSWSLSACTVIDREQVRAYALAFDTASDIASATLAAAENSARSSGLDLTTDLEIRRQSLVVAGAYNRVLLHFAEGGDPKAAASDALRLADALVSIAGVALAPVAGELTAFARPIGLLVTRVDDLIARERYGEIVQQAGPLVEELLETLAADGPALGTIIAAPVQRQQAVTLDRFVGACFEFMDAAAGHGDSEVVAPLLDRLNELRAGAALPAGVIDLDPIAVGIDEVSSEADMQRLRELLDEAEATTSLLARLAAQLQAQQELTQRYGESLRAAQEAMRALRDEVEGGGDASAAIEALIEHLRFFREAHQAYQEATS